MTPGGGLVHLSSFQISYLLGWENKSKGGRAHPREWGKPQRINSDLIIFLNDKLQKGN